MAAKFEILWTEQAVRDLEEKTPTHCFKKGCFAIRD